LVPLVLKVHKVLPGPKAGLQVLPAPRVLPALKEGHKVSRGPEEILDRRDLLVSLALKAFKVM
jgi:hypothetical protein